MIIKTITCLTQEHSKAKHAQHDFILHLHFTRSLNSDDADRTSVSNGIYILWTSFHPTYSSFVSVVISGYHWTITNGHAMCCLAAASVERNLSGHGDFALLITIFICVAHHMLFNVVFLRALLFVLYHQACGLLISKKRSRRGLMKWRYPGTGNHHYTDEWGLGNEPKRLNEGVNAYIV